MSAARFLVVAVVLASLSGSASAPRTRRKKDPPPPRTAAEALATLLARDPVKNRAFRLKGTGDVLGDVWAMHGDLFPAEAAGAEATVNAFIKAHGMVAGFEADSKIGNDLKVIDQL